MKNQTVSLLSLLLAVTMVIMFASCDSGTNSTDKASGMPIVDTWYEDDELGYVSLTFASDKSYEKKAIVSEGGAEVIFYSISGNWEVIQDSAAAMDTLVMTPTKCMNPSDDPTSMELVEVDCELSGSMIIRSAYKIENDTLSYDDNGYSVKMSKAKPE